MSVLEGVRRVLLVHAHPDDESIATGALIADLVARGIEVGVLTATRGEMGEVVEGLRPMIRADELSAVRAEELRDALAALGVTWHAYLGRYPARAGGRHERDYHDSGMRWIRPGLAGPDENVSAEALTSADIAEVANDLSAGIAAYGPDLVITYDEAGGYGHPDHLVCYHATCLAMAGGTRRLAVILSDESAAEQNERFGGAQHLGTVIAALRAHATQVAVEGTDIVHSGGQRQPIITHVRLRAQPV